LGTEGSVSGPIYGSVKAKLTGSYRPWARASSRTLPRRRVEGNRGDQWAVEGQLQGELATASWNGG
jgi:hypothetical protein